jgi:hypothetical protein
MWCTLRLSSPVNLSMEITCVHVNSIVSLTCSFYSESKVDNYFFPELSNGSVSQDQVGLLAIALHTRTLEISGSPFGRDTDCSESLIIFAQAIQAHAGMPLQQVTTDNYKSFLIHNY